MLSFLFPRLTQRTNRGAELFEALAREARQPHWYVEGRIPDTIDGRFAMLATATALALVRLERGGDENHLAVALTERFVEAMDAEHRELGIGDPKLGKTVRKLVGALARRVDLWRRAVDHDETWSNAVSESLPRNVEGEPAPEAITHCEAGLRSLWARLDAASDESLAEGRIG